MENAPNVLGENKSNPQISFAQQETSTNEPLKSAWQLFKDAYNLYRSKFATATGIILIPVIFSVILNELSIISTSSPALSQVLWPSIVKLVIWLVYTYFSIISTSALLFAVKNNIGVKKAYIQSFKSSFFYILVVILGILIIIGGTILLVIPGIIFSLWFIFAIHSFVFEDKKGMEALYRSKQLLSGNFWKVMWRLVFIFVISLPVTVLLIIIGKSVNDYHGFINNIFQLFIMPFLIFFYILLFQNLVRMKQGFAFQETSKLEKVVYYFSAIIATPLLLALFILSGAFLFTNDIPTPNDSELQLSAIDIPKEQNSFYVFMEAKDKIYWPKEEVDKNGIDTTLSREILQKNDQALGFFEKGVSLPFFQQPNLHNPEDYMPSIIIENINFLRDLAKVNSLKAQNIFNQRREKEALDQSIKTMKMAQMIQDGKNSLIGYLTGLSIKETGLNNTKVLIKDSHLPSAELLSYENELNKYKESSLALQEIFKGEYMMFANSLKENKWALIEESELKNFPFPSKNFYSYKPNKTQLLFITIYGNLIDNSKKKSYAEINHAENKTTTWLVIFTENAVGKILSNIIAVSFDSLFAKKFEENFSVKATQLLLALKACKQDTGNLPDSLQDLIPSYIPELIQDPFDGKTIKYSPEKKIIYSTGKDLVDNGGNISESNWKDGEDLGFKVDF